MTFLVDANVPSEPTKPTPNAEVVAWLRNNERELVVDPIMLGEIGFGIGASRRGSRGASSFSSTPERPANRTGFGR